MNKACLVECIDSAKRLSGNLGKYKLENSFAHCVRMSPEGGLIRD